jgi:hypothetical protein
MGVSREKRARAGTFLNPNQSDEQAYINGKYLSVISGDGA